MTAGARRPHNTDFLKENSLNLKELKEILQMLAEREITEFELEEEGMKLRIRKATASPPQGAPAAAGAILISTAPAVPVVAPAPVAAASRPLAGSAEPALAAATATAVAVAAAEDADPGLTVVKSPIVGTFYRSADPNSAPFVSVGDTVKVGQVLCIIEAMKLMNEIEAEVEGRILAVLAQTGRPVEYGEPLFKIGPV